MGDRYVASYEYYIFTYNISTGEVNTVTHETTSLYQISASGSYVMNIDIFDSNFPSNPSTTPSDYWIDIYNLQSNGLPRYIIDKINNKQYNEGGMLKPTEVIMNRYASSTTGTVPDWCQYTYTGTSAYSQDSYGNFLITLKSNGSLSFKTHQCIDLFAVGGGGGGGAKIGGGGGGGYTTTVNGQVIQSNTVLTVVIGAGGTGSAANSTSRGGTGEASSVTMSGSTLITANGGQGGDSGNGSVTGRRGGGNGGSGGGGGSYGDNKTGGTGGTDGSNGTKGTYSSGNSAKAGSGGTGQGTTTRAFGESDGTLYSGGGGASGGGKAGDETAADANVSSSTQLTALPNRGGGGGGGYSSGPGSDGGSGVVLIRNHYRFTSSSGYAI